MTDFTTLIQDWYRRSKRELPWRLTNDPYKIWISEVILQQTRVEQGLFYYEKFIFNYPDVKSLANASEDEVLNLWQGLGYYSRARNMHFSAKMILTDFGGVFPKTYKEVRSLKGVGDYTAAAITSIAYNLPHAVVDGNVYRVLSRYLMIETPIDSTQGKKEFDLIAANFLDQSNPGDHNQAMMELGALICTPNKPACESCPLTLTCLSRSHQKQLLFPVKSKKTKVTERLLNYLVFFDGKNTLINKRVGKDIWEGLYDFPLYQNEFLEPLSTEDLRNYSPKSVRFDGEFTHILSHQRLTATFWVVEVEMLKAAPNQVLISLENIEDFPLPQLLIRYIQQSSLFERE
jgi:A/G-specific adenine glycosylase